MRRRRLKIRGEEAVYHCVTRTVNKEMLFDSGAKEFLRKDIWRVADFSGVEILTFCVMTNHFHVLVRVPDSTGVRVSDGELLRRYRGLYPIPTQDQPVHWKVLEATLREGGDEADELRRRLLSRMHDISQFMKTLKQRFSVWYNRSHGRVGTLWSERFKSTVVEDAPTALRTVAAYIDLNPVRGGIVTDPKDYRWSGYGDATGGSPRARSGIASAVESKPREKWRSASATYRRMLYWTGAAPNPRHGAAAATIANEALNQEMERGGRLPPTMAIRCRVRYFTDGAVLGSAAFVQQIFESSTPMCDTSFFLRSSDVETISTTTNSI